MLVLTFPAYAQEYPSCDVSVSKNIEKLVGVAGAEITASVIGEPCYKATLTFEIKSKGDLLYAYKEPFKPHIATNWESVTLGHAKEFLKNLINDYNFKKCNELPEIEQNGDLPYFDDLLVTKEQYLDFKNSGCSVYIHTFKYYEGNRVVVFPLNQEKAIVVR